MCKIRWTAYEAYFSKCEVNEKRGSTGIKIMAITLNLNQWESLRFSENSLNLRDTLSVDKFSFGEIWPLPARFDSFLITERHLKNVAAGEAGPTRHGQADSAARHLRTVSMVTRAVYLHLFLGHSMGTERSSGHSAARWRWANTAGSDIFPNNTLFLIKWM